MNSKANQVTAMKSKAGHHRVVSNILFNSAGNIVSSLVGFLLAPVMVHTLGDAGYGIWVIALQLGAYLGLMDLGIRVAVGRYLTHHYEKGERDQVDLVITSAILILSVAGVLCVLAGSGLALLLPRIMHIPAGMISVARWAVFLVSLVIGLSVPGSIFPGAVASLSRYDLLNLRTAGVAVVRGLAMWLALIEGGGIVGIAAVWVIVTLACLVLDYLIASRLYYGFHITSDWPAIRRCARTLFGFSAFAFLLSISSRLILWSDNLVIAIILGPAAVTAYAIGNNLVDVARNALASVNAGFVPLATAYNAKGDVPALRRLLIQGSRMGLVVILPGVMAFFIIGGDFITLWMGARYRQTAGAVLILLGTTMLCAPLRSTCNQILYGMNKHRRYGIMSAVEAFANLGLSIVLAYKMGVIGVAWGTAIPALIVEGMFVPIYTAQLLQQSRVELYWQTCVQPMLSTLPYCVLLFVLHRVGWVNRWSHFFVAIAMAVAVYAVIVWFWTFSSSERDMVRSKLRMKPERARELAPAMRVYQSGS